MSRWQYNKCRLLSMVKYKKAILQIVAFCNMILTGKETSDIIGVITNGSTS